MSLDYDYRSACEALLSQKFQIKKLNRKIRDGETDYSLQKAFWDIDKEIEKAYRDLINVRIKLAHKLAAIGTLSPTYSYHNVQKQVEVDVSDDIISISFDGMLPVETVGSRSYTHAGISTALQNYIEQSGVPLRIFERCYIFFIHHYPMLEKEAMYRDFDNLDKRAVMNVLVQYCIPNDSPGAVKMVADTHVLSTQIFTEVYIVPASKIDEFLTLKPFILCSR